MKFKGKTSEQIDYEIELWHVDKLDTELFTHLGWTQEEYKIFVEKGFMVLCKIEIIDRIEKNAHVLGRMGWKVDKWRDKPWLMDDYSYLTINRFDVITEEQKDLVEQLREL